MSIPSPALLRTAAVAAAALLAGTVAMAQATASSLRLEFAQPTGSALATDDIPIYLRLTNTDLSQAFVMDPSLPLNGLNRADVPTSSTYYDADANQYFTADFATYTSFFLNVSYGCSGSFTNVCDAGAYEFDFANNYPWRNNAFVLDAGASTTYLFGTFKPIGGAAPGGTYEFYRSEINLIIYGEDAAGHFMSSDMTIASTCAADTAAGCATLGAAFFTREVTAVPEPSSTLMLGVGLAGMMAMVARQRRRR